MFLFIVHLGRVLSLVEISDPNVCQVLLGTFGFCGGLLTKAALALSSSAGQGRENKRKGSWVEIRAGRDHSPINVTGKTDSIWGKN